MGRARGTCLSSTDPRDASVDNRVELACVEVPPLPIGGMVVAGQLTATLRAGPAAAFRMLDVDVNLG